jgi:hypothetical protein
MKHQNDKHEVACHDMNHPDKPAVRHYIHDNLRAVKGILRMGDIVHEQEITGYGLHHVREERDKTEGIKYISTRGNTVSTDPGFKK